MSGFHDAYSPLGQGLWLGLATGPYCFAACAPVLLPFLCAEGGPALGENLAILGRFLAGRLGAYLLFGLAAGALGARLSGSLPAWLSPAALAASALLMLACAAAPGLSRPGRCLAAGRWTGPRRLPWALGFLTGINLCPPFLTGLVVVLDLGRALAGAAFFAAFFVATSLYLLPVLGVWPWLSGGRARSLGRWALGAAGLWYLGRAAGLP